MSGPVLVRVLVRLVTTMAGPDAAGHAGDVVRVPAELGIALVNAGAADLMPDPLETPLESAVDSAAESTTPPNAQTATPPAPETRAKRGG